MQVFDLDGNEVKWYAKGEDSRSYRNFRSQLHLDARKILNDTFPTLRILEEVQIPIRPHKFLYLDFYVPMRNMAIEVQGRQHLEYVPHFHSSKYVFYRGQAKDRDKKEWCEINDIEMVYFQYNEKDKWSELV